jgi:hypothetical protein
VSLYGCSFVVQGAYWTPHHGRLSFCPTAPGTTINPAVSSPFPRRASKAATTVVLSSSTPEATTGDTNFLETLENDPRLAFLNNKGDGRLETMLSALKDAKLQHPPATKADIAFFVEEEEEEMNDPMEEYYYTSSTTEEEEEEEMHFATSTTTRRGREQFVENKYFLEETLVEDSTTTTTTTSKSYEQHLAAFLQSTFQAKPEKAKAASTVVVEDHHHRIFEEHDLAAFLQSFPQVELKNPFATSTNNGAKSEETVTTSGITFEQELAASFFMESTPETESPPAPSPKPI